MIASTPASVTRSVRCLACRVSLDPAPPTMAARSPTSRTASSTSPTCSSSVSVVASPVVAHTTSPCDLNPVVVVAAVGAVEDLPVDQRLDVARLLRIEVLLHPLEDLVEDQPAILAAHALLEQVVGCLGDDAGELGRVDAHPSSRSS